MLPTLHKYAFSDPRWIFEPKWDGYRGLCLIEHGSVRFFSRRRRELTKRFPELLTVSHDVKAQSVVLDGEIVALDENGKPDFSALQNRRKLFIVYFAFDCLVLNENDLRQKTVLERKRVLKRIVKAAPRLRYTDHVVGEGKELFLALEKLGLEGMVAKRSDSLYLPGRSKLWLKIKTQAGKSAMQERIETWGR